MKERIVTVLSALIVSAFVFFVVAALVRLICWSFGFNWNWRLPVGTIAAAFLVINVLRLGND